MSDVNQANVLARLSLLRTGPAPTLGLLSDGSTGHLPSCPCRACEAARDATQSPTVFDDAARLPRFVSGVSAIADQLGANVPNFGYAMATPECGCDEHQNADHFKTLSGANGDGL